MENLINKELKEVLEGEDLNRIKSLKDQVPRVRSQRLLQGLGLPQVAPAVAATM